MRLTPGANVIKIFTAMSYEFLLESKMFASSKPFQPSLLFVGKARSPPLSGASDRCFDG